MPIATSNDKIILSTEKKTEELANKFIDKLTLGDVVFLYGEIGVGKTTFVRYLINGFQRVNNLKMTEVTSPTFNLINEYEIKRTKINHFDLFRIKSLDEIRNLDLFDDRLNSITLVEWPQIINKKPKNLIELVFKYDENHQQRSVQIKGINLYSFAWSTSHRDTEYIQSTRNVHFGKQLSVLDWRRAESLITWMI